MFHRNIYRMIIYRMIQIELGGGHTYDRNWPVIVYIWYILKYKF